MLRFVLVGVFVFGAFVVLAYRRRWQSTGRPAAPAASSGAQDRPAKTPWDWLQLLGILLVLTALAFLLNDAQSRRDQRREGQRATQQRTIENQRAAQQRRSSADAERENTLRTYLAQMSDLMLDRRLLSSKPGTGVRRVARTATLTAVRRLDAQRRGLVVRFLVEARLVRREKHASAKVLVASADLAHAVLSGVDLSGTNLRGANLRWANLRRADLRRADLTGADLRRAKLRLAGLRVADLRRADLSRANLRGANLRGAGLRLTSLPRAKLNAADLRGAFLRGAI